MLTITNSFVYIAFLMFLAGGLLALEKYTKWKVFNVVPPLVWIYVLNMIFVLNMVFCTMGVYASDACSAAYSALKNNLLYAMIFVMLLRCDFRRLAKLGGRMIAIFLGCTFTLAIGFLVFYPLFMNALGGGEKTWAAVAALPTWPLCRMPCPWTAALTAAPWLWILCATPCGSLCCCWLYATPRSGTTP